MGRMRVKRRRVPLPDVSPTPLAEVMVETAASLAGSFRQLARDLQPQLENGNFYVCSRILEREEKQALVESIEALIPILEQLKRAMTEHGEVL